MSNASARFYPRAPRYTLRASDDNQMRFALMQTKGNAFDTELHDVSTTGLKFKVFNSEVPRRGLDEGDVIKIEFKIPSGKQIACFATVTRIDQTKQWSAEFGDHFVTEVAVQFRHLPTAWAQALEKAMPKHEDGDGTPASITIPILPLDLSNRKALMLFSLSSIALFSLFMFLSTSPQQWLSWFR